jgi:hypothetical protein
LLAAIKDTTSPSAVVAKLDRRSAKAAKGGVDEVLERTRDRETFAIYAELSAKLARDEPADVQIRTIFRLLRHPLTAGEPTPKLLALLEQAPGVQTQSGGDLWKAVEWAETEQKAGRLNGLALDAPLQIRLVGFAPLVIRLPQRLVTFE